MSDRLELTFEQQEQIDKLAYWASKPSSNQNKDKHALIAYVEQLIQSYIDSKIILELEELQEQHETGVFYSKIIPERIAELSPSVLL